MPRSELYLGWNDMNWDLFGNVEMYNEPKKDMCRAFENNTNILLTGNYHAV